MAEVKKISRQDLYSDDEVMSDNEPVLLPKLEFEIVENVNTESNYEPDIEQEEEEEFDFPLFSFGGATEETEDTKEGDEERGRTMEKSTVMKVSLRSPSPVEFKNERPVSYYFSVSTEKTRGQCSSAAITAEQVISFSQFTTPYPTGKVVDLAAYNAHVERELTRSKKKVRPGKKAREARISAKGKNQERKQVQKKLEEEAHRKLMKKLHKKRGGKKHKKKNATEQAAQPATATPSK